MRPLTPNQMETLALLSQGHARKEIAKRLGITDNGVSQRIRAICDKLGAVTSEQMMFEAGRLDGQREREE